MESNGRMDEALRDGAPCRGAGEPGASTTGRQLAGLQPRGRTVTPGAPCPAARGHSAASAPRQWRSGKAALRSAPRAKS